MGDKPTTRRRIRPTIDVENSDKVKYMKQLLDKIMPIFSDEEENYYFKIQERIRVIFDNDPDKAAVGLGVIHDSIIDRAVKYLLTNTGVSPQETRGAVILSSLLRDIFECMVKNIEVEKLTKQGNIEKEKISTSNNKASDTDKS